ncbi:MAG: GNAT family N-acetyltransferase [Clostridium sp.]|nr:GNAT family N-acetyltransferase [Clostridium sp.]
MEYKIDNMKCEDWDEVGQIYLQGIKTKIATFNSEVPKFEKWDSEHIKECRFVAKNENKHVIGWVALSPTSNMCAYRGVAEVSIYIDENYRKMGIGQSLLKKMIIESEKKGFWTLESLIIEDNIQSIELHKKCGFREVGIREKLGKMDNGIWHDVVVMERRSKLV